jgi:hypothetical protein
VGGLPMPNFSTSFGITKDSELLPFPSLIFLTGCYLRICRPCSSRGLGGRGARHRSAQRAPVAQ